MVFRDPNPDYGYMKALWAHPAFSLWDYFTRLFVEAGSLPQYVTPAEISKGLWNARSYGSFSTTFGMRTSP